MQDLMKTLQMMDQAKASYAENHLFPVTERA